MDWDRTILNNKGVPIPVLSSDSQEVIRYRVRMSLLKYFGDPENDNDFESHLSHPFTLP